MSETAEQVVLQKSKDEGARSGATKDYSTRKAQGEAKAPVKYTDPDAKAMPQGKLGDVASEASHDYDAEKGKAKAEVQYEKPLAAEDGNYGRMKCPKCNQGNIMADSKKCPNCGASQSELVPMAEDKRMGDFPINKTHSAYDTPPMDAKVQGEGTAPSMEKSKMAADTTEAIKNSQNNNDELRLVKEHLRDMAVKFEAEQQTWIGERRELVAAKTELSEKLSCALEEIETARLDLSTKNSMYKSLLEENQSLTKKLENFAAAEKNAMVEELVNTKLGLGLITEEEKAIEMASYSEKSVDTLKVLHEDMVKNAKKLSNLVLGKKFGVPVAAPEKVAEKPATTESGKIAKGKAVESCDEACEKAKIDEELAEDPVADKGEIGFANSNDGAIKNSTVFGLITRALNTKKER